MCACVCKCVCLCVCVCTSVLPVCEGLCEPLDFFHKQCLFHTFCSDYIKIIKMYFAFPTEVYELTGRFFFLLAKLLLQRMTSSALMERHVAEIRGS